MTRILIVDEVRLSASLLAAAIDQEPDLGIAAVATTPDDALDLIDQADLLLISTSMPDDGAVRLTTEAVARRPDLPILVVGLMNAPELILRHIEAGASGYVLREDSVEELLKNVHAARQGKALVSPNVAAALMTRISELAELAEDQGFDPDHADALSDRELEVLHLIAESLTNQEIADRLFIAVGTVKNHVHSILKKLNVRGRDEAAAYLNALSARPS